MAVFIIGSTKVILKQIIHLFNQSILLSLTSILLLFLVLLVLLVLLLSTITASISASLLMTAWASWSFSLVFFSLFAFFSFSFLHDFSFLFGQTKVSFASSKTSRSPTEHSSSSFEVYNYLWTIDFTIVSILVGCGKVFLVIELHESIATWLVFEITNDSYRFDDTVFLQIDWHLPQIRNANFFK